MAESLEGVLNRVIDWLKYEEAKNGALVAFDGVGAGLIVQWLTNMTNGKGVISALLEVSLAALLISLMIALFSFYPLLDDDKAHGYAAAWQKGRTKRRPSTLFFGEIAGTKAEDYLHNYFQAIGNSASHKPIELDYAEEIVTNAEIAVMKLQFFKKAFVFSFLGLNAMCLAAIARLVGPFLKP